MRLAAAVLVALTTACARPPATAPSADADARAAWQQLATLLPGRWLATTPEGREIDIDFRLISNDSALAESFGAASGRETVTVYHPDASALVLTHYCGQGNQATLRVTEATANRVVFRLSAVSNLGPDQGVMVEMILEPDPSGGRALVRTEVYRAPDGSLERTTLRLRPR